MFSFETGIAEVEEKDVAQLKLGKGKKKHAADVSNAANVSNAADVQTASTPSTLLVRTAQTKNTVLHLFPAAIPAFLTCVVGILFNAFNESFPGKRGKKSDQRGTYPPDSFVWQMGFWRYYMKFPRPTATEVKHWRALRILYRNRHLQKIFGILRNLFKANYPALFEACAADLLVILNKLYFSNFHIENRYTTPHMKS